MRKLIVVIILAFTISACTKSETQPVPAKQSQTDTVLSASKLQGKWEIIRVEGILYVDGKLKSEQEWKKGFGWYEDGVKRKQWWTEDISYIYFDANGTYRHTNSDGVLNSYMLKDILTPSGKWSSTFNEAITLTNIADTVNMEEWVYKFKEPYLVLGIDNTDSLGSSVYESFYYLTFEKQNQ